MAGWGCMVPLAADELFSTWLARAALGLGCDPLVLTGAVWPRWRAWTRDLDRGLNDDRLRTLVRVSGLDAGRIASASLRPLMGSMTRADLERSALWPWVLAQGTRNRRRFGGLQYCPQCLAGDRSPYFRRKWRLAWMVRCEVHERPLLDACPACGATLEPHRLSAQDGTLGRCATCGSSLLDSANCQDDRAGASFQAAACAALTSGHAGIGSRDVHASEWFDGMRRFVVRGYARGDDETASTRLRIELLPTSERALTLERLWRHVAGKVPDFVCGHEVASPGRSVLPRAIRRARSSESGTKLSKAVSAEVVRRDWARLQRRLRLGRG